MRLIFKIKKIKPAALMPVIAVLFAMNGNAVVLNCQAIVDDVKYRTVYSPGFHLSNLSDEDLPMMFTLEVITKSYIKEIAQCCQAELKTKGMLSYDDSRVSDMEFLFYDGTRIPSVEYAAILMGPDASWDTGLPNYDADKDENIKRSRFYTGDVWIQDSVCMQALPDLRKTKYHIVFDIYPDGGLSYFDKEELTSIRTALCGGA